MSVALRPNAFYVVRGNGNISLTARGALAPSHLDEPILFSDLLIEVQTQPDLIDSQFLRWAWDSRAVRKQIEAYAATAAGIYKINLRNLATVRLLVPDLATQSRAAGVLNRLMAECDQASGRIVSHLADIDRMPGTLLRQAFMGAR